MQSCRWDGSLLVKVNVRSIFQTHEELTQLKVSCDHNPLYAGGPRLGAACTSQFEFLLTS